MAIRRILAARLHHLPLDPLDLALEAAQHLRDPRAAPRAASAGCAGPRHRTGSPAARSARAGRAPPPRRTPPSGRAAGCAASCAASSAARAPDEARPCLLLLGLDRDKAHRRPAHRLADRRRVRRIVLVPPHIRLGISRRDQPHVCPNCCSARAQYAPCRTPRSPTRQGSAASRTTPASARAAASARTTTLPASFDPVHLEHVLRQIETDCANLLHGWLPHVELQSNFGTSMPSGGHPPHHCERPSQARERAKQSRATRAASGLLRRYAPRNDGFFYCGALNSRPIRRSSE